MAAMLMVSCGKKGPPALDDKYYYQEKPLR